MRPHDVEDEEQGAALGVNLRGFCQKIRPGGPKFHTIPLLKTHLPAYKKVWISH